MNGRTGVGVPGFVSLAYAWDYLYELGLFADFTLRPYEHVPRANAWSAFSDLTDHYSGLIYEAQRGEKRVEANTYRCGLLTCFDGEPS